MQKLLALTLLASAECFQLPSAPKLQQHLSKLAASSAALAVTVHSEAAHAKSVLGVNGGLDFGPLAGDQPGGEGTGKVRAKHGPRHLRRSASRGGGSLTLLRAVALRSSAPTRRGIALCSVPCTRTGRVAPGHA